MLWEFERWVQSKSSIFPFVWGMDGREPWQAGGNKTILTDVIHHCTNTSNCWNLIVLLLLLLLLWSNKLPSNLFSSLLLPHFTGFPFAFKPCDFGTLILSDFLAPDSPFHLLLDMVHLHWLIHPYNATSE